MEDPTAPPEAAKTDAEYKAEVEALLAQMKQMDGRSDRTWDEIERLRTEPDTIRGSSDDILTRIDRRLESILSLLQQMTRNREREGERDRLQHENLALRIENALLRFERRLTRSARSEEWNREEL